MKEKKKGKSPKSCWMGIEFCDEDCPKVSFYLCDLQQSGGSLLSFAREPDIAAAETLLSRPQPGRSPAPRVFFGEACYGAGEKVRLVAVGE